ncbi:MAG TPA: glycosyltransferase family 39 protein [Frateuria sp.]|uniref:glycosyltransferase family 39 protein n=1 Tax=Frateuria sp. TaxID=2211372 RepID=UPI002D7FE2C0|nr:glycosyltransferase family 39 protein [Frateuria sp.]HET6803945.1 glycosyltransferase family 39 protein [Frateuria sp.]
MASVAPHEGDRSGKPGENHRLYVRRMHPHARPAAWLPWWAGFALLIALRVLWLGAYPVNSDEPQHAHVAWNLAIGGTPYRDAFDNHGPLFGLLYAHYMRWLGPRADILWWLRLAVIPWYALALWSSWVMARRLYTARVAAAGVLLAALMQIFFVKMGEFRTDDMWTALWLAALALVVGAHRSVRRGFVAGLCIGAALAVSQKTLPLLATALVAGVAAGVARPVAPAGRRGPALAAIAGGLVVPLAMMAWLAGRHDLGPAYYDMVAYGLEPTGGPSHLWRQVTYALVAASIVGAAIVRLRRDRVAEEASRWRAFLGLQALLYMLLIWVAWPLSTPQDFLPVIPTATLVLVGAAARPSMGWLGAQSSSAWVVLLAGLEFGWLLHHAPPWRDALAGERSRLAVVLRCTAPSDSVMDAKSGAIFRPRPYYPVLESLELRRLEHGLAPDRIAAALVAHDTKVLIPERLPLPDQAFAARNYLPGTAGVYMAGMWLPASGTRHRITIRLPGVYALSDGVHPRQGSVDGGVPASRWMLGAGPHWLVVPTGRDLFLIWSKAWACGWRPRLPSGKPA